MKNFIGLITLEYLKAHDKKPIEVYSRLKTFHEGKAMTRSNFNRHVRSKSRSIRPEVWSAWRKSLNMSEDEFWNKAKRFYESQ